MTMWRPPSTVPRACGCEAFDRLTTDSFVHQDGGTFVDKADHMQVLANGEAHELHDDGVLKVARHVWVGE